MKTRRLKDALDTEFLPISKKTQDALDLKADLVNGKISVQQLPTSIGNQGSGGYNITGGGMFTVST